jgi:plasmid maintenance system antidote protein VapI
MTPSDLRLWIFGQNLTHRGAARALGVTPNRLYRLLDGRAKIPVYIDLACRCIADKLEPWSKR